MNAVIDDMRIVLAELNASARIQIDRWGIAHIFAQNEHDLFFLQGFNAARDRLWQIDLWRKRGLGLLAADFGPGYLEQDRASRLFLYRGDMDAEWAAYAPDAKAICAAFVAGINACIGWIDDNPTRMPPEFAVMGTRPALWQADDVVRIRSHAITRNAVSEVLRSIMLSKAGPDAERLRRDLDPPIEPKIADGIDLASVPLAILDDFKLATAPVSFSRARLDARLEDAEAWRQVTDLGDVVRDEGFTGSNNWVVHGSRTASGRPILANDPHRAHGVPGLRMLVHLSAPGFDAIGAGEPVIPGLSLGHNGHTAFGLTIFYIDQEDVYVYDTDLVEPDRYRFGDGFEDMLVEDATFDVKGHPAQSHDLHFTRHGPVLYRDPSRNRAYAIRSVWFEPGSAPYMKSLASMRSQSVAQFERHVRHWNVPSVNHVCADSNGLIGWVASGLTPVRSNWDGLTPVPGDGSHEWTGFLDNDLLPRSIDPDKGYFATANEMNLPADYPAARRIGHEWVDRSRATRIHEAIAQTLYGGHTVADSVAIQTDVTCVPARRIGVLLGRLMTSDAESETALNLLENWDHRLTQDSPAAALFEVWWTAHLKPALFERAVPDPKLRPLLAPGDVESILAIVEDRDPDPATDLLLLRTLTAAYADCRTRLGDDPTGWRWGDLHHAYFEHPLSAILPEVARPAWDSGPYPIGGSSVTPMHTGYRALDFRCIAGASIRLVIDVGGWDNSVAINAPGQSGDPRSLHYRDLAAIWARGGTVPLLYSREAVDGATVRTLHFSPRETDDQSTRSPDPRSQ